MGPITPGSSGPHSYSEKIGDDRGNLKKNLKPDDEKPQTGDTSISSENNSKELNLSSSANVNQGDGLDDDDDVIFNTASMNVEKGKANVEEGHLETSESKETIKVGKVYFATSESPDPIPEPILRKTEQIYSFLENLKADVNATFKAEDAKIEKEYFDPEMKEKIKAKEEKEKKVEEFLGKLERNKHLIQNKFVFHEGKFVAFNINDDKHKEALHSNKYAVLTPEKLLINDKDLRAHAQAGEVQFFGHDGKKITVHPHRIHDHPDFDEEHKKVIDYINMHSEVFILQNEIKMLKKEITQLQQSLDDLKQKQAAYQAQKNFNPYGQPVALTNNKREVKKRDTDESPAKKYIDQNFAQSIYRQNLHAERFISQQAQAKKVNVIRCERKKEEDRKTKEHTLLVKEYSHETILASQVKETYKNGSFKTEETQKMQIQMTAEEHDRSRSPLNAELNDNPEAASFGDNHG